MLVAVIALYVLLPPTAATRARSRCSRIWTHVTFSPVVQKWLFLGFFIAFAIKEPRQWPFHTWLPDALATASQQPGTAVLAVGVMDKVGTFGMIRVYCQEAVPRRVSLLHAADPGPRGDRDPVRGDRGHRPAAT